MTNFIMIYFTVAIISLTKLIKISSEILRFAQYAGITILRYL
jgi:hypothetical protein